MSDDPYILFESSEGRVIDESLARRLIDSQFPQWSHLPIRAFELDGWDNRSFRLGSGLTVRLPSGNWYAKQVDKEQRWLPVLALELPLPIPSPVAKGEPDAAFPYPWSVYRWLDGEPASTARIGDLSDFATTLARFLNALGRIDATAGPAPGQHNFFRGDPPATYEEETIRAIDTLGDEIPAEDVKRVWADAMATSWERDPVWFHGDVAAGNLLVRHGRLAAVLDFGSSGVGDPACDTVLAWTFLSGSSRDRFRAELDVDAGTWSRGRGWALWKALITLVGHLERGAPEAAVPRREIERILADYAQDR
ncbi:MAG: aminoglycoside phosphotransferase family protein [Actinomycetota bacterium]|nr:aminoglycoside phosphotransferase family protein [Actinomycetota bacterium]